MQLLLILWEPNARWEALDEQARQAWLAALDSPIAAGRAAGMVTLGWSRVDSTLPRAPHEGFVGLFGLESAADVHALERNIAASGWYEYFDSTNISIAPEGMNAAEPHRVYARLLGLAED